MEAESQGDQFFDGISQGGDVSEFAVGSDMKSLPEPFQPGCHALRLVQGAVGDALGGVATDRAREDVHQRGRQSVTTIPDLVYLPRFRSAVAVGALDTTNPFNAAPLAGDEVEGQGESMPVQLIPLSRLRTPQACTPAPTSRRTTRRTCQSSHGFRQVAGS